MPYPEAVQAMLAGGTGIDSNFASPPFAYMELADPKIHTVANSTQILGGPATLIMAYTTERFHAANPKAYGVFLAALKEAEAFINADKKRAAEIYVKTSKVKVSLDLVMKVLDDPNNLFTVTPQGIMIYVNFMHRIGLIQHQPKDWQDLFFPEIHDLQGS
jgi:NitT/TauT family transport system substrate-binding protein